ncbi:hypothetical protein QBZ16_003984 [Prototheca wickerhamii]|uniref:Ethanolaminephosphotransferase n=1 Tax=Prototheca wickerhamii TaxID=3111 RepID=A0AAD9II41_PROWI|nr:hypothetical protein QBZ16_003984 [Prototheca wickerhamii]
MGYLSKQALSGLKHYAYKPGGYTILDNWHQPFWNYTVELLPMWLAPNLVTLTGLAAVFAATLTGWYYDPDLLQESPRWVFGLMAFAQFFYLHVDCLDGKQARRTGSSSPLGQLFDHGCDTLVIQFVLATLVTSLDVPPSWMLTLGTLVICTPFIMAHWEEYHTGTMVYGNGLWGVTEANYAVVLLHFVSFVFGTGFWTAAPLAALAPAAAAWLRARACPRRPRWSASWPRCPRTASRCWAWPSWARS